MVGNPLLGAALVGLLAATASAGIPTVLVLMEGDAKTLDDYAPYQVRDTLEGRSPRPVIAREVSRRIRAGGEFAAVGRKHGADYVAVGQATEAPDGWHVELRLLDTATGRTLARQVVDTPRLPTDAEGKVLRAADDVYDRPVMEAADRLYAVLQPEPLECRMPAIQEAEPGWLTRPPPFPPAQELCGLIREFYTRQGRWAGKYVIETMTPMREESTGPLSRDLHVRYRYRCVKEPCEATLPTGYDQRIFSLRVVEGNWRVEAMGEYFSATP